MSTSASSTAWLDEYSSALDIRDSHEQSLKSTFDLYTQLADRSAAQHQPSTANPTHPLTAPQTQQQQKRPPYTPPPPLIPPNPFPSTTDLTNRLTSLQTQHTTTLSSLNTLQSQHTSTLRKLRDREDELAQKRELLQRLQDDLLAAEMQVNVAEEERTRVLGENRELVGRLVGERQEVVERLNREGGWT